MIFHGIRMTDGYRQHETCWITQVRDDLIFDADPIYFGPEQDAPLRIIDCVIGFGDHGGLNGLLLDDHDLDRIAGIGAPGGPRT